MVLKNSPLAPQRPENPEEEERSLLEKVFDFKIHITVGIVVLVILVLAVVIVKGMQESKESDAWSQSKELRKKAYQALSSEENMQEALRELEDQVESFSGREVHPWLLFFQARLNSGLGRLEQAQRILEQLNTLYPNHPFTNPDHFVPGDKPLSTVEWERLKSRMEFEKKHGKRFSDRPKPKEGLSVTLKIKDFGDIKVGFFVHVAPIHAANFIKLARDGFFNGTTIHRITDSRIQGGDPDSKDEDLKNDGRGDPGYTVEKEIRLNPALHTRGTLSAASSNKDGPDSGSQFFVCTIDSKHLDGKYTPFGEVLAGIDVVEKISHEGTYGENTDGIAADHPIAKIVIESVEVEGEFVLPEKEMPGYFEALKKKEAEAKKAAGAIKDSPKDSPPNKGNKDAGKKDAPVDPQKKGGGKKGNMDSTKKSTPEKKQPPG